MAPFFTQYSVEKNPPAYEEYSFELPELYRQIAKEELREDDTVRESSLIEMRQWIANNPHIRKCRTDAKFLLRFLRFQKFSVPMACEALERYLSIRELHPTWFKQLDCNDKSMKEILEYDPFTYLGQDSAGRMVMLIRFGRFHAENHTALQDSRYTVMLMETILEWEEVQIGGCQVLIEYEGCTVSSFEKWSSSELKLVMDLCSCSYPLRYGEIHAFGLPKFGVPAAETLLTFGNPKMRDKIKCHSSVTGLEKYIEPTMKPKEYGGAVDLSQLNQAFRKRIEEQREITLGLDQMEIDVEHYASVWEEKEPLSVEEASVVFNPLNIE
ncbi:alpha-tocopherol transfer protein-like [Anopheles ziemanni]|uniref:alpha-tocopherol transfer protein-like n=1 Tax=Anopheles coustani TaxID=139045 RepID=UPI00265A84A5|nr:alpha-tocopherol transfer protein-like [Anopheles coustani]XP_058178531.1 alpha-tocopherol transfer protein-like [Anopheles ziemanni]